MFILYYSSSANASPVVLISVFGRFLLFMYARRTHDANIPRGWYLLYFAEEGFYFSWFLVCTPLCSRKLICFVFPEADSLCNSLSHYYILLLLKCCPSRCITSLTKYVIVWVLWWCREMKCFLDIIRLTTEKIMKTTKKIIKVNYENYTWRNKIW